MSHKMIHPTANKHRNYLSTHRGTTPATQTRLMWLMYLQPSLSGQAWRMATSQPIHCHQLNTPPTARQGTAEAKASICPAKDSLSQRDTTLTMYTGTAITDSLPSNLTRGYPSHPQCLTQQCPRNPTVTVQRTHATTHPQPVVTTSKAICLPTEPSSFTTTFTTTFKATTTSSTALSTQHYRRVSIKSVSRPHAQQKRPANCHTGGNDALNGSSCWPTHALHNSLAATRGCFARPKSRHEPPHTACNPLWTHS